MITEQIQKSLEEMYSILINAKACFQYCYFLNKPDFDQQKRYLDHSKEIKYIGLVHWKMCIIELTKLIDVNTKNSHFSIYTLFPLINQMSAENSSIIKGWKNELKNVANLKTISDLRNKFFAHTDSDRLQYLEILNIEFEDVQLLIDVIEKILIDIYSKILDTQLLKRDLFFNKDRFSRIISVLAKEKEDRINKMFE